MTDEHDEHPLLDEIETMFDEQTVRLKERGKRGRQGRTLLGVAPYLVPAGLAVIAFVIT